MNLGVRLRVAALTLVLMLACGTAGYVFLVDAHWLDGLYMTVITVSTVGFGEVVPGMESSPAARTFTIVLILIGIGLLLYVVSTVTAFFVEGELTNLLRRRKMEKSIATLSDHVIVCGIGRTGQHVTAELSAVGMPFVVIENDPLHLEAALEEQKLLYIEDDATHDSALLKARIEHARGLITTLADDKDNLFIAFTARHLNPSLRIVSGCGDPRLAKRLERAGADTAVAIGRIGGLRLASEMLRPQVVSFLDRMLRPGSLETWRFEEIPIAQGSPAAGQPLGSLRIPETLGIPVLAVTEDDGQAVTYHPDPDVELRPGQALVLLAESSHLDRLRRLVASPGM